MTRYAALVLAAGLGSRFRASGGHGPSKLVAQFDGAPVIQHVVQAAVASRADPVFVITGHAAEAIEAALSGLPVTLVANPDYRLGLATSLRVGIAALPGDVAGTVILLGDMPLIRAGLIDQLLEAATLEPEVDAVIPVAKGRRGNPVVLARSLWAAAERLEGDAGARHLLQEPGIRVKEIETGDGSIALDVDQASDLDQARTPRR